MVGGVEAAFRTILTGEAVHRASVAEFVSWVTGEEDTISRTTPVRMGSTALRHRGPPPPHFLIATTGAIFANSIAVSQLISTATPCSQLYPVIGRLSHCSRRFLTAPR